MLKETPRSRTGSVASLLNLPSPWNTAHACELGLTQEELQIIYRIQLPAMHQYEADIYYNSWEKKSPYVKAPN
jgi:hypothetical protein